jgi:AcrR family transcriptional regulator
MSNKMSSTSEVKRRHGATLEKAILDAAWEELKEVGYDHFTFDNVAKRAGTSKPVLYRRWPNRFELVRAALLVHRPLLTGFAPDTGTLRGDVIAILEHMASGIDELRTNIAWGMLTDAINDRERHGSLLQEIRKSNIATMKAVFQKAEARGEVDIASIPDRVITLPIDLTRHEMLISGLTPTKEAVKQIVDDVFLPLATNNS